MFLNLSPRRALVCAAFVTISPAFIAPKPANAKPIAFAEAWTFMHERERSMIQTELFYAPTFWWSLGPVTSIMKNDENTKRMETTLAQTNFLVKRWNLPNAQGNIFASYGVGETRTTEQKPHHAGLAPIETTYRNTSQRYVVQGDYETRTFYTSFKVDALDSRRDYDRTDTFQIGFSPVAHDYEDLAVWFVAQAKKYRGMDDKTEGGGFVRLFRKNIWVEIGMTERRQSTFMFMLNY
jgi:hypothetical protein